MTGYYTIRINFIGGIASPGELNKILKVAEACEVQQVRFGLRQQLIMYLSYAFEKEFKERMEEINVTYFLDSNPYPNMISSYVSEEVFQHGNWLREGIYKDIFDSFEYKPTVKINISDHQQSFTPFFSGHINFISSDHPNFWYMYLRVPKSNKVIAYDQLIFSNEIAKVSEALEERLEAGECHFNDMPKMITMPLEKELELPSFRLPYYEGFNRYGKKSWLGIYRRGEGFETSFLKDLTDLCLKTKIGEICLTPWKSIILKNITENDRKSWSALLAQHDINVRDAANELNWQIEDASPEAIALKNKLVGYFNKNDLRTFGICLGIKTVPKTEVFASIMVSQRRLKFLPFVKLFDITYTTDFDPNGRSIATFAKNILSFQLPEKLRKSVLMFNQHIAGETDISELIKPEPIVKKTIVKLYQCPSCFTIYDPSYGDELQEIEKGIEFQNLPENYSCSVCDTDKTEFLLSEVESYKEA